QPQIISPGNGQENREGWAVGSSVRKFRGAGRAETVAPLVLPARNDFRIDGTLRDAFGSGPTHATCREENGGRPCRHQIPEWNELREKRRQESPVPTDQPGHRRGDGKVERVVPG